MLDTDNNLPANENKTKLWLKRIGVAGFLFFLLKGLLWIAFFYGLNKWFR